MLNDSACAHLFGAAVINLFSPRYPEIAMNVHHRASNRVEHLDESWEDFWGTKTSGDEKASVGEVRGFVLVNQVGSWEVGSYGRSS